MPASANSFAPGVCSDGSRSAANRRNELGEPSWTTAPRVERDHTIGRRQAALQTVL